MNIIICGTAYPLRGGISHYNALLYQELSKEHRTQIITFSRQYPKLLFPGKTQQETGGELMQVPGEQLMDSINPLTWLKVGREICRRAPDLVIFKYWIPFFGPCFGTIARHAKRNGKTKVVFICDNVIPHEKRPGDVMLTRYAFRPVDGFIVQSQSVEADLKAFWPQANYRRVAHPVYNIFGNPIPQETAREQLSIRHKRVILFFGYVRAYKGLDVLLESMALLKNDPDLHLFVVGEFYDDEQKYRGHILKLGLEERVTVVADYVPNDRVGLYFSAADVVILPYKDATQSGIAQIAYNFNKPVIATNVGGLAEVVLDGRTGYVVPPNDPNALAQSIARFYSENKAGEFGAHVSEEKTKYSWKTLADAIVEFGR